VSAYVVFPYTTKSRRRFVPAPAHPGGPGKGVVKRLCVYVCVILKQIFFGQLSSGKRPQCGPLRRYKDTVKVNMKRCGLQPKSLSTAALDQAQWRTTCQSTIAAFEETRAAELDMKRAARKQQAVNITDTAWPCDRCNKICSSRIGLFAHRRTHR